MIVIALDAMGGDFAPRVPVEAALQATRDGEMEVVLVGDQALLERELARHRHPAAHVRIRHAPQAIAMDESATALLRGKPEASVRVAVEMVARGEAQAAVSAGHSGALMVAAKHVLRTLEGIERPAILTPLPLKKGIAALLDSGANADCKPHFLLQFAWMGDVYARAVLGIAQPRVGLISNGSEPGKGNELVREAFGLLSRAGLNFVGNVEPRDIFKGKADVLVTDGFVGNLVLKTAEAANEQVRALMREALGISWLARLGARLTRGAYRSLERRKDPREIGGSLLVGVNGVAMVCHGASNARALRNALRRARDCVEHGLVERIAREFRSRAQAAGS
jgi:glycerol-3-phosphate acyltransferase PlsX